MAKCIDCIHSEMCYWKADFVNPNTCAHYKDKADVAQKSEVEKQKIEIEALKIANEKMYSANKEQEVEIAREIFEEIESNMTDIRIEFSTLRAIGRNALEKIKKKYTEGET